MQAESCTVRYVSNAGLILVMKGSSIGIDCFSQDQTKLYPDTPPEVREELWTEIEEGNLETLIFTHEHGDHFCPEDVKTAYERNEKLQICSGKQVVEMLCQKGISQSNLVEIQAPEWMELGSFRVGFLDSLHEGEQYANVQNLTLLIEAGERRFVVSGDAAPCAELFEQIGEWSRRVDCFFVPFPYVGLRSTRKLLAESLDIQKIFVLHQPRKEADIQNWVKNTKQLCQRAEDGLPAPIFPEELGDWYKI